MRYAHATGTALSLIYPGDLSFLFIVLFFI